MCGMMRTLWNRTNNWLHHTLPSLISSLLYLITVRFSLSLSLIFFPRFSPCFSIWLHTIEMSRLLEGIDHDVYCPLVFVLAETDTTSQKSMLALKVGFPALPKVPVLIVVLPHHNTCYKKLHLLRVVVLRTCSLLTHCLLSLSKTVQN